MKDGWGDSPLADTTHRTDGCYRCGQRLYFSARKRGLGVCFPCEQGLDRADLYRSIGARLQSVAWSPYVVDARLELAATRLAAESDQAIAAGYALQHVVVKGTVVV